MTLSISAVRHVKIYFVDNSRLFITTEHVVPRSQTSIRPIESRTSRQNPYDTYDMRSITIISMTRRRAYRCVQTRRRATGRERHACSSRCRSLAPRANKPFKAVLERAARNVVFEVGNRHEDRGEVKARYFCRLLRSHT